MDRIDAIRRFEGDAIAAIEVFVGRELDPNTSADDRGGEPHG